MLINILMVVLVVTVQLSYQRPSLSNNQFQGRHGGNGADIITAAPISEEEFQLSLYQSIETNEKNSIIQGVSTDGLVEGDIAGIEVDSGGNKSHNYVDSSESLWPGGIVPYAISDIFSRQDIKIIARGIRNIQDKSCIQFVPRTTETDYIQIISGNTCSSEIGRTKGRQDLSLQKGRCVNVETVIHELMHALGFEHEHNRPDRDDYIRINEDNLLAGAFKMHFQKYDPLRYKTLTDYDLNSIMHYKAYDWARNESFPSIRPRTGSKKKIIGSIDGLLSPLDQLKLKTAYKCDLSLTINVECPVPNLGSDNSCFKIPKYGCYCLVKQKKSREEADQFCRDNQMQLVWFENKSEEDEVASLTAENDMLGFWTSGADRKLNGNWRWEQLISSASFPVKYTNWCGFEEPDNYDGNEFYIVVRNHPDGKRCWEDAPGHTQWPSVCKPPLSTKMLLDNLVKLHSQMTVAFNEIRDLQTKNKEVSDELRELKEANKQANSE